MARKQGYNYFAAFIQMADYACKAAEIASVTLGDFDKSQLPQKLDEIHNIEHDGDEKKHEMMKVLSSEFLPPLEVEDIAELAQMLDDVIDSVEDILIKLYAYDISCIRPEACSFLEIISKCCVAIKNMLEHFENFKKSKELQGYIIDINALESEGDALYTSAMHALHANEENVLEVLVWSRMLDCLEDCCDATEDVADAVHNIIMKNT